MNESIRGTSRSRFWTIITFILIPILGGAGLLAQQGALGEVRDIRRLERIPLSPIGASLPGPVQLKGEIEQAPETNLLEAHWTKTPCVWYRALKEVEKRDSDGNTSWSTVFDQSRSIPFLLDDKSGRIRVVLEKRVDYNLGRKWRRTSGKERFTEYRLDPGDDIHLVGMLEAPATGPQIAFPAEGEYVPIISDEPISNSRASRGLLATILIILSVFLVASGCVCALLGFRLHNALAFAVVVGTVESAMLLAGGLMMMSNDLTAAQHSLEKQESAAKEIVSRGFASLGIDWDGAWTNEAVFERATNAGPPGPRLAGIRQVLATRAARTSEVRTRFPQNLVGWVIGLPPTPVILARGEILSSDEARIPTASPFWLWPLIIILVACSVALVGLLAGFSKVKLKRLIENVPTTPATEVEIGISELSGTVASCADIDPLAGPLTNKPCVWFRYLVQEWRGSGKNRHLHTIEDRTRAQVFLCTDQSGSIPVASHGAHVISGRGPQRSKGIRVYTEWSLRAGDPLYVLGSAEIDPATGDSLRIEKDPQGLPYLISNLPERRLKTKEIVGAFWCLAFGIAAVAAIILGLLLFTGRTAALDQLLAALAAIITVGLVVDVIMYNDLVFLRQRVHWARSNIDVALKKRHDLLPQLESIAKGYMKYEGEVQPILAKLRSAWSDRNEVAANAGASVANSQHATGALLALREKYPDLKADTLMDRLMHGIVKLENEIAARRDGYNAAVERYRARIKAFPEIVLAKLFRFRDEPLLGWDSSIRELEPLNFETEPRSQEDLGMEEAEE